MSNHARIEELSDTDSDPPEDDISSLIAPSAIPSTSSQLPPEVRQTTDRGPSKHYQCLYPVYFDSARTRATGRRVSSANAISNPLAREIADATAQLGLPTVFEPDKTHPKDWANPGRVRVLLKQTTPSGQAQYTNKNITSKHHLYLIVAKYLKQHPTTADSPLKLRIAGLPVPQEVPKPAVPRGWKINEILPLHSPALTGGGVSENFLQDMMAEMAGEGGMPGLPGMPGGATGGSVEKKKGKKKK